MPTPDMLDLTGLDLPRGIIEDLLRVDREGWLAEIPLLEEYFSELGDRLPKELYQELERLDQRLKQT
jgi:phosphoenolpyruvate carboxykinase (GTP)